MNRLRILWVTIRSSLWFVPTLMVMTAIAAAVGLVEIDKLYQWDWSEGYPLLFGAGAEGSRGMLSTIAGSMITVAGVTFSLTISALVTASSQYSSRILRNFMQDRRNQVVLGAFVGIFAYCLVVIRTIRGGDEGAFVPSLAVFVGLLLALLGIGVLVFFIHHIATAIQASTIVEVITAETLTSLERALPVDSDSREDEAGSAEAIVHRAPSGCARSEERGYVQGIDISRILEIALARDAVIALDLRPGDFVMEEMRLLRTFGGEFPKDEITALRNCVSIHRFRTIDQEFGFGIRQLVDIALKALSPGINDTTTAIMCIQHLSAILSRIGDRTIPDSYKASDGVTRLSVPDWSFAAVVEATFDQIRHNAGGNVAVMQELLRAIVLVADQTQIGERRATLLQHAKLVADLGERTLVVEHDRERVRAAALKAITEVSKPLVNGSN